MNNDSIEYKALLADSGEARLSREEQSLAADWVRDVQRLKTLSRASLCPEPVDRELRQRLRTTGRLRLRIQRRRRFQLRLVAAAALVLLAWSGWDTLRIQQQQERLSNLDNVLALLEYGDGQMAGTGGDLQALSQRLTQLQEVDLSSDTFF